ncbi:MAG: urease accessory UreF family protein [Pseudomonadota bacterium]
MTDTTALLRLMSWLSPVFPTGGFAYSAGLEQAVAGQLVTDQQSLEDWIKLSISNGSLWNDAVIFCAAHRGEDVAELCLALCNAAERRKEMLDQGAAFYDAATHWFEETALSSRETPLPVLVAQAAALADIDAQSAIAAYLHTFASNQLQCSIRLSVTGQNGAAQILAGLEPHIQEAAKRATTSTLDDLGTLTFMADIAAMNHETLQPRLFLS